jgi:uncharacterized membrane protein
MSRVKALYIIVCLVIVLAAFIGPINSALAESQATTLLPGTPQGQASPPEERIELTAKYPMISGAADKAFKFDVGIVYKDEREEQASEKRKRFALSVAVPTDWNATIQAGGNEISAIDLRVNSYAETVTISAMAVTWGPPDPGEYTITLEVAEIDSGEPQNSIELIAEVTARYAFSAVTNLEGGRLNIKAEAGKDSYLPITVTNTGTATLDRINFSSDKPEGWSITFKPETIESLSPWASQQVEVAIRPPDKTISGDYMTTLNFDSEPWPIEYPKLDIRVTVLTSTHWGWIGAGIVVAIIAGLAITFRRLGRR